MKFCKMKDYEGDISWESVDQADVCDFIINLEEKLDVISKYETGRDYATFLVSAVQNEKFVDNALSNIEDIHKALDELKDILGVDPEEEGDK